MTSLSTSWYVLVRSSGGSFLKGQELEEGAAWICSPGAPVLLSRNGKALSTSLMFCGLRVAEVVTSGFIVPGYVSNAGMAAGHHGTKTNSTTVSSAATSKRLSNQSIFSSQTADPNLPLPGYHVASTADLRLKCRLTESFRDMWRSCRPDNNA